MMAIRICQAAAALISFSIMASTSDATSVYEFRLIVTVGVILFAWSIIELLYLLAKTFISAVPGRKEAVKLLEAVLEFGAYLASPPPRLLRVRAPAALS